MDSENNQNQLDAAKEAFSRREQKNREAAARRRKKTLKKAVVWAVLILAIFLVVFISSKNETTQEPTNSAEQFFAAQNRDHIKVGESHPAYNSDPPTGGWHYDQPVQSGIYDKEFPDEQLIHNLEHGHVWISYRADLDQESIEKLADIAKDFGSKIVMTLRSKNDTKIALASWEYLLKMDTVDEAATNEFIKDHRGRGPENIVDFGFKDFRTTK
ncbi:MAG: hypothetical protein A3B99_03965 [Candidatus Yanofskybacteria bacterium RIFCSPHIGHO2_02_FULL_44_12b]|uniref:BZIP domain-containing protein n=2 Tax=Candidatus Yanofskyibacteriota TaxID=1752733 RepID=A0A1F8GP18_9BACT|nr:MAG: hypothetical protein UW79_C0022G0025 [Candidatus Yanofskybacteria bacterium GW2011_GWA2_44_9]OGN04661.1 MAG: hypothetical protein A2659_00875 [Candidatus Yanofskybacteria bacterium RIFCSPHIGHO2_01_FULL_44_24]OGN15674.1 MAG: hypothetical protein A3B99_03965 [Candidatus Yanofskybacteria bacterium RIFCSPHIGHO2_02_FULL_44_12b]OGN26730.1 MAG: hypothetical protein A2925_04050 [Candidatus Yanofskybacteria bacterium RIFCSPLOWO2_01_FULL_44_22]